MQYASIDLVLQTLTLSTYSNYKVAKIMHLDGALVFNLVFHTFPIDEEEFGRKQNMSIFWPLQRIRLHINLAECANGFIFDKIFVMCRGFAIAYPA